MDLLALKNTVQKNCHIADANGAGDYTLCIYLLKMREYFRWENGFNYKDALDKKEVGSWLRKREQLWDSVQEQEYESLLVNNELCDPFESNKINQYLLPHKLIYSGGFGRNVRAHFFLGVLEKHILHEDYEILIVADEYARDLTAPPAMSQGKTIYIRKEAFHRLIWEKYEQWLWNTPDNAFAKAISFYPFETNHELALEQMTAHELDYVVAHEIGEVEAHKELGAGWEQLLQNIQHPKLELLLRAIRDLYADSISTLPKIIQQGDEASLYFYIGNLSYLRKDLYPKLLASYEQWQETKDFKHIQTQLSGDCDHWLNICLQALKLTNEHPVQAEKDLISYIENQKL